MIRQLSAETLIYLVVRCRISAVFLWAGGRVGSQVGDMQLRRSKSVRFNLSLSALIWLTSVESLLKSSLRHFKGLQLGPNSLSFIKSLSCPQFYFMNAFDCLWDAWAQTTLTSTCACIGERDECRQAIAPAEKDGEWFGRLEHHDQNSSHIYTGVIRQPGLVKKNIAASQKEMLGALGMCFCCQGGARHFGGDWEKQGEVKEREKGWKKRDSSKRE